MASTIGHTAGPAILSDGVACTNRHDGMAVVDAWHGNDDNLVCDDDLHHDLDRDRNGHRWGDDHRPEGDSPELSHRLVLVRNHERAGGTPYTNNRRSPMPLTPRAARPIWFSMPGGARGWSPGPA